MSPLTLSVDVKSSSTTSPGKFALSVFIIDCEVFFNSFAFWFCGFDM